MDAMTNRVTDIKRLVIGDIDGVVADCSYRLQYIQGTEKNWDKFYGAEMANDKYIKHNGDLLQSLSFGADSQLVFLTGRPERTRELTRLWLNDHLGGVVDYYLICRLDGDHRKSPAVKAEMLETFLDKYDKVFDTKMVISVFDDDPKNLVAMAEVLNSIKNIYDFETFCVGTKRI